ncbi:Calcium-dependent protein [Vigna angularis]|uniref:Calcium-dependent protein n=1 Tax=Phaseolus angularis TaxID=3914 RepID=A0A8T0KUR6_PHAAN|nr:Calcium-dependent protein [Vigna angularis]
MRYKFEDFAFTFSWSSFRTSSEVLSVQIPAAVAREDVKSSFSNADHHGKRGSGAEAVKQKAPITVLAGVPKENIEDCYLVDRELGVTYLCIDRDTRELLARKSISKRGCSGSSGRLSTSRMSAARLPSCATFPRVPESCHSAKPVRTTMSFTSLWSSARGVSSSTGLLPAANF